MILHTLLLFRCNIFSNRKTRGRYIIKNITNGGRTVRCCIAILYREPNVCIVFIYTNDRMRYVDITHIYIFMYNIIIVGGRNEHCVAYGRLVWKYFFGQHTAVVVIRYYCDINVDAKTVCRLRVQTRREFESVRRVKSN